MHPSFHRWRRQGWSSSSMLRRRPVPLFTRSSPGSAARANRRAVLLARPSSAATARTLVPSASKAIDGGVTRLGCVRLSDHYADARRSEPGGAAGTDRSGWVWLVPVAMAAYRRRLWRATGRTAFSLRLCHGYKRSATWMACGAPRLAPSAKQPTPIPAITLVTGRLASQDHQWGQARRAVPSPPLSSTSAQLVAGPGSRPSAPVARWLRYGSWGQTGGCPPEVCTGSRVP